jgi:hypothetical protein
MYHLICRYICDMCSHPIERTSPTVVLFCAFFSCHAAVVEAPTSCLMIIPPALLDSTLQVKAPVRFTTGTATQNLTGWGARSLRSNVNRFLSIPSTSLNRTFAFEDCRSRPCTKTRTIFPLSPHAAPQPHPRLQAIFTRTPPRWSRTCASDTHLSKHASATPTSAQCSSA